MAASPVIIEQVYGYKRSIVLRGRGLPYRPVSWTAKANVQVQWMPGNPVASAQVVGPELEPTTFTGMWKDKFLFTNDTESGIDLVNFPSISAAGRPEVGANAGSVFLGGLAFPGLQAARLARTVASAFDLLRREAQLLRVEWANEVRFGYLTRFAKQYERIEDIGYELEFTWVGEQLNTPIKRTTKINVLATSTGLGNVLQELLDSIRAVQQLQPPNRFLGTVSGFLGDIVAVVSGLVESLRVVLSTGQQTGDLISSIKGALRDIKQQVQAMLLQLGFVESASTEAARRGDPDAMAIAALVQGRLRARLIELAAFAAEQERLLDFFASDQILATVIAANATSLRDLSTKYYGQPNNWQNIATYNGLQSSIAPRGTLIRVPRL